MDGRQGYRDGTPLDPGAEPLPDILTRPVDEIVAERLKTYMLPEFWLRHAAARKLDENQRLNPRPITLILATFMNLWLGASAWLAWRDFQEHWQWGANFLVVNLLLSAVHALIHLVSLKGEQRKTALAKEFQWLLTFVIPLIGLWRGGHEMAAAIIRWHRLKTPLTYDQARAQILARGRAATVDALKRRLERAIDDQDEDGTSRLVMAAEEAIRGYERSFDDYRKLCEDTGEDFAWARELLQRQYLVARQAVESVECGPTQVWVLSPEGEHDDSPFAHAKTLVPGQYRVARRTP